MSHPVRRPVLALLCVGAGLALAGCPRPGPVSAPPSTKGDGTTDSKAGEPVGAAGLFRDWSKPDAALVISGQMVGYLEPCGCSEDQKGGLGRRHELVEGLKGMGWPVAGVDLGTLINDPNGRGGPEQTKFKLDVAFKALKTMDYRAIAISADDLRIGVTDAIGQYVQHEQPKVVAANVKPADGLESALARSVKFQLGPVKIGVTAAVDPGGLKSLNYPARDELLTIESLDESLKVVLADLEKDTDVQVLLAQGEPELARELASKFPGFDVVVATSPYPEPPDVRPVALNDGKTWVLTVGKKGMHVGVLGIYSKGPERFQYRDVTLSKQNLGSSEAMRQLIDEDLQATLRDAQVVENYPRREAAGGAEFVGARACRQCHPATYAKWEATKHAHAFDSLMPRGRTFDAECASCHTTGLDYTTGYRSATLTPNLKGNQCENCHGPASKHVAAPDDEAARQALHLTVKTAEKEVCIRCHDEDNSPKFNFSTYWGQIAHTGLDRYNTGKVREGLDLDTIKKSR
jgi:hypothetical protein